MHICTCNALTSELVVMLNWTAAHTFSQDLAMCFKGPPNGIIIIHVCFQLLVLRQWPQIRCSRYYMRHLKSTFQRMIVIYHLNFTQNSSTQLIIIILTIIVIPILSLNGWGEDKSTGCHYLSSQFRCLCCTQHRYAKVQLTYFKNGN